MALAINGINMSSIQQYGQVTLPELRTHVNNFIDTPTRTAQNNYQLFKCLNSSIDGETKEAMQAERETYLVAGATDDIESGLLFAKKLLITAEVDSRATTSHARENLGALDALMRTIPDSDINEFNMCVRQQLQTLTARGESTQDLVTIQGLPDSSAKGFS